KTQSSNFPFTSCGMISLSSIVKYEIHLLPSTTYGAIMASVGHASIQRLQLPQCSVTVGLSYSNTKSKMSSATKKNEPTFLLIKLVFLPIQPNPDFCAHALSKTGAESTKTRPPTSPTFS